MTTRTASQGSYVLGISAYYHDSAAALLKDGQIVAAAQEERFTRKKHDSRFPSSAAAYCLREAGIGLRDISQVTFYDKPLLKFDRLLKTYLSYAPQGLGSFLEAMPAWITRKLFLKGEIETQLRKLDPGLAKLPSVGFLKHHHSHAASAFFPSPFHEAAVLCIDGVGEWDTLSVWHGKGETLTPLWSIDFPHSLGLLYSAFTYYAGFKVNSGEYKLMGLAPYGTPKYASLIREHLIDLKADGTFRLNLEYFDFPIGFTMTTDKFHSLFGGPPRQSEAMLSQREMDLAASVQQVTEECVLRLGSAIHRETGSENLCLAGGVALNCVANGKLLRQGSFKGLWIQPAAGDAGGALGAAYATWHQYRKEPRQRDARSGDSMRGSYLGPAWSNEEIGQALNSLGGKYTLLSELELFERVAAHLAQENVIGWVQDRMEFGPRALGNRSILGDPRSPKMQSVMNLKIKYRESFRPFAPAVLAEDAGDYFDLKSTSPYMLLVASVLNQHRRAMEESTKALQGIELLKVQRSSLPAVTHVDFSARVQTVHRETNPKFYALLRKFKELTGCGMLINTSFNVRGEPPVCSVEDAFQCFMRTGMDYLVVGNYLLDKREQSPVLEGDEWKNQFELD